MGFLSNLWKLIIIAIGVACLILLIISLSLPWYATVTKYKSALKDATCVGPRILYWFETKLGCQNCNDVGGCSYGPEFPGLRTTKWCDDWGCDASRSVFIATFVLVLLAFVIFLVAVVLYALPMCSCAKVAYILAYIAFAFVLVALLVFSFALVPAIKKDMLEQREPRESCPADGGPCASFGGDKTIQLTSETKADIVWGPDAGWYFAIFSGAGMLFWALFACCCCAKAAEPEEDKA